MLAMAATAQPSGPTQQEMFLRSQEVGLQQTAIALNAAQYILDHAPLYEVTVVQQAHGLVLRCMKALDNIRVAPSADQPDNT
jgi:hypothetical protein